MKGRTVSNRKKTVRAIVELQRTPVFKRLMELQSTPLFKELNNPILKRFQYFFNDEPWDDEPWHTAAIQVPALEHRAPQNTDISPPSKAPGNAFVNSRKEPKRTNNLEHAVQQGLEILYKSLGRKANLDELIHHLKTSDESSYILCSAGDEISWKDSKGKKHDATRRAINHHYKKY